MNIQTNLFTYIRGNKLDLRLQYITAVNPRPEMTAIVCSRDDITLIIVPSIGSVYQLQWLRINGFTGEHVCVCKITKMKNAKS